MDDCWNCSCSLDRTYVGAGCRCRRASVQAIVLSLPRDWAGRQNQARPTAKRHRWPQERNLRRVQLLPSQQIFRHRLERGKLSPSISARRCKKCRAPAWHLSASKTTRTSPSSGPISSSSGLMGRRNETRRVGEKAREPLGVSAQRLVSRQCWVDWPAQPYLKPAQTI